MMSAVPGGATDVPIIAGDLGADVPKVTVLQLVRLVIGMGIMPSIIYAYDKKVSKNGKKDDGYEEIKRSKSEVKTILCVLCTLFVAVSCGTLGTLAGCRPARSYAL